jgi:hypothetical protein
LSLIYGGRESTYQALVAVRDHNRSCTLRVLLTSLQDLPSEVHQAARLTPITARTVSRFLLVTLISVVVAMGDASAQDQGVIRGRLVDGSGWAEAAVGYWVGLARFDSVIAETRTDEEGRFEFVGSVGDYREIHLFTYLGRCFHPIRVGTEFAARNEAVPLELTALPGSKGTGLSDSHCEPTRRVDETTRAILTEILNEPPLAERIRPWLDADSVVLMSNRLRRSSTFSLLGRDIRVDHSAGGFFGFSNCSGGPPALPAVVRDTLTVPYLGPVETCWVQNWIYADLRPDVDGSYLGWWSVQGTSGRMELAPVGDSLRFRVVPDGDGWSIGPRR